MVSNLKTPEAKEFGKLIRMKKRGKEQFQWHCERSSKCFGKSDEASNSSRCVMVDEDLKEINAVRNVFPHA
ncbi:hypothetical protein MHYP_G00021440 [Metynnis hypsauchen]